MNHKTVAIIGAGRVGSSVGFLLKRAGYTVTAVAARSLASAEKASAFIGAGEPATDAVKASYTEEKSRQLGRRDIVEYYAAS